MMLRRRLLTATALSCACALTAAVIAMEQIHLLYTTHAPYTSEHILTWLTALGCLLIMTMGAWHAASGILALGDLHRQSGACQHRRIPRWCAPLIRRVIAGTIALSFATGTPVTFADSSPVADDMGWTPTTDSTPPFSDPTPNGSFDSPLDGDSGAFSPPPPEPAPAPTPAPSLEPVPMPALPSPSLPDPQPSPLPTPAPTPPPEPDPHPETTSDSGIQRPPQVPSAPLPQSEAPLDLTMPARPDSGSSWVDSRSIPPSAFSMLGPHKLGDDGAISHRLRPSSSAAHTHEGVSARPVSHPAAPTHEMRQRTVTVHSGDCLWTLTQTLLTAAADRPSDAQIAQAWPQLYAYNVNVIGDDPSRIYPGMVLSIPDSWMHASHTTSPHDEGSQ